MQLTAGTEAIYLRFNPSVEVDVVTGGGYEVFAVPAGQLVNGDFVPASNNRKYKGPNTSITIPATAGIWGVKAAAYDVFGDTGLNYTPLMTCTVMGKLEDMLQALTGQITSSQLNADLNSAVDAVGPLSEDVGAINSTLEDPETGLVAQVTSLQSLVSNPDTGLITKLDGLQSSVTDPEIGLVTLLTNLSTIVEDPATGLVKQVADNQASLGDNTAALSVEQKVRASSVAPNWVAGSYSAGSVVIYTTGTPAVPYMFQSLVDGNDTTPSVIAGVATATTKWKPVSANLYAQMMLKTDVNGHITGIGMANDGVTGTVEILADKFAIVDPGHPTASIAPFVVSTVGGVTQVGIDGALMVDGSLVVGGNVTMGPEAIITWENLSAEARANLTGPPGVTPDMSAYMTNSYAGGFVTKIGSDFVFTGKLAAEYLAAGTVTGSTIQTKADPGTGDRSRAILSATNNRLEYYSQSNTLVASLGAEASVGDSVSLLTLRQTTIGLFAAAISASNSGYAISIGLTNSSKGIVISGDNESVPLQIDSTSSSQNMIRVDGGFAGLVIGQTRVPSFGGIFNGVASPLKLEASTSASVPTHTNVSVGCLWVTSTGLLYIYTPSGWSKVGAQ